jgi:hypothetical protein
MPQSRSHLVLALSVLVCLALLPDAAQADKCLSTKLKAIAKKEAGLLGCQATAAKKGDPSGVAACDAKVMAKFNTNFAKAGTCAGDLAVCEAIADDCRSKVRAALPDGTTPATASTCEAARLKAAGKKASRRLGCYGKAAKKDEGVDAAPGGCLDKASAKFEAAFEKVSGCTGDGQTAAIETLVDGECVTQLVTTDVNGVVVDICPTAALSCGNTHIDVNEECDPPGSSCGGSAVCGYDCRCPCDLTNCPCDPLDPSTCLYPFPSDFFTVADGGTDTGKRVNFSTVAMPKNQGQVHMVAADYNLNDGFSPGTSIILKVPGIDLAMTGAAPITDIAQSLDPDAPIVVINADTLAQHLSFVELDANAPDDAHRSLIIRPSVNFLEGTRYIVALRNLKDGSGATIPAGPEFALYRDNVPTGDPFKEARRPHMESLFTTLLAAGIARSELYLAWDFTVASERNLSERLLFMRDDGFDRLDPNAPSFSVTSVTDDVTPEIFRRINGTFTVERYVDNTVPPARFVLDGNGLPTHQGTQTASFRCDIPRAALPSASGPVTPARASIYGHGLLGSHTEVSSGNVRNMANEHNFVFCATDWIGMSSADVPQAIEILKDLGKFPTLTDRLQQAMLNQLYLARLMIHASGFTSHAAFQDSSGNPVIDTSDVFYDGNSQGGIFGGTVMAIAQDITRGVLGVPGMNYSLLLTRSVDFDGYEPFLNTNYPNRLHRPLLLALIQMLWDRSDPNGYAHHMTTDPLPNTPPHQVLLHEAFGDHQVTIVATEVQARTIGASVHAPILAPGRSYEVTPLYGIPTIPSYPFNGSAIIVWDSGTPTPPTTNTPNRDGDDPHSDPRNSVQGRIQKSEFLKTGGAVVDVCAAAPCVP